MRTTAANYRGGIASLLAGTRALGQGMKDLNAGFYGFTPQGRREAELRKMLDEAMKKRAGMDIDAANAPPPPDPRLAGMPRLPFDTDAPIAPPSSASSMLAGAPGMPIKPPVAAGMPMPPAPPPSGTFGGRPGTPTTSWKDTLAPVSVPGVPSMDRPAGAQFSGLDRMAGRLAAPPAPPVTAGGPPMIQSPGLPGGPLFGGIPGKTAGPVGIPGVGGPPGPGGPPPLTPDDQAMLSQTGLGSLLGMPSAPKGGSPATPPAQGAAEALTIQKRDPFAAGPLAAPPPTDPFGGERKGLLLDRAIATLQKNPGQASAMTDRLLGRAQEDTPDAIRADIELLGSLDGSPEGYRSAMPQMRSNLGRKELFAQITEGINRKRGEDAEGRKFGQQKELKRMEEEGATGRTKMTIEGQKDVASTRAAATLESNLARIIATKQRAEGKPILSAKDYLSMERSLLKDAEANAQAAYTTMADARGYPKEGFTDEDVQTARTAWQAAQVAQAQWDAQASLRRWQKEYVTASATETKVPGPADTDGATAEPQTPEEWSKYLSEVPDEEFDAAQARYEVWKATQE